MLREFFCSGPRRRLAFAWGGLAVFLAHSVFKAWVKYALNGWYAKFYDELQDLGSSAVGSEEEHMATKRAAVWNELVRFALIVAPAVVVGPLAKWVASVWRFTWRMALVRSYLVHYDPAIRPIEGTAQRIHEDTQRFEVGMHECGTVVVDSLLTLIVFTPVLLKVGAEAHPPGLDWPAWLLMVALAAAVGGLGISMLVGRRLVSLEVENQKVEAELRTRLVILEQTPSAIVGEAEDGDRANGYDLDDIRSPPRLRRVSPLGAMARTLAELWQNYKRLFLNFAGFNTWIGMYDQTMVILPFLLVTPLMFAQRAEDRITLGTLMKVSHAFDKVFSAMAVVTDNWARVNEFRSTIRRLGEFERAVYERRGFDASLLRDEGEPSDREVELKRFISSD